MTVPVQVQGWSSGGCPKSQRARASYGRVLEAYYDALRFAVPPKGDVRAFVGVATWVKERQELKRGHSSAAAHLAGFRHAVEELKQLQYSKAGLRKRLAEYLEGWVACGGELPRPRPPRRIMPPAIPSKEDWRANGLNVVSLFTGALGLDLGFLAAGFALRFATDIDPDCQRTATANVPWVPYILGDFDTITTADILKVSGLKEDEVDVLIGGPPCQPFSTAGKRQGLMDPRSSPLTGFVRAVRELRPKAFVMEEVTGLQSARLKHVSIAERARRPLQPEEERGSAFKVIVEMLESTGYQLTSGVVNAADFGAPQVRERVVFIGMRKGVPEMPRPSHSARNGNGFFDSALPPWHTFWEATADLPQDKHTAQGLAENTRKVMKLVPPGGHWRQLPPTAVKEAMGGAFEAGGGKMGFYRRLTWDEPSPTVVTSPTQKGTMFCHPEADRPLSTQEYRRIQGFPDSWAIPGSKAVQYKQVGNAVSVHMSYAVALQVMQLLARDRRH